MSEPRTCDHCTLPVPPSQWQSEGPSFCCGGCETVYMALGECGLEDYYRLRTESPSEPATVTRQDYSEFDDPAFLERHVREREDGSLEIDFFVASAHCAACLWVIEKLPVLRNGITHARLELLRRRATVGWDPGQVSLSEIAQLLDSLGYAPRPYRGSSALDAVRAQEKDLLIRLAVTGAVAGNVMLISFALYGGFFHGMSASTESFLRWTSLVLAIPSVLVGGGIFFRGAIGALRRRIMHTDLPVSLGILAGTGWGLVNTVTGTGPVYFDTVTALIFLLLAGRFLQRRQLHLASESTDLARALVPSRARVLREGQSRVVAVDSLAPGDVVEILAGDTIPVDGVVSWGQSSVDRSLMTGESIPESVSQDHEVLAGTVNVGARIHVRVAATQENTRAGKILREVESQLGAQPRVVTLVDSIAGWFVSAVVLLAVTTFLIWLPHGTETAVENALALLVITCPCALGLATPLAVGTALAQAAREGFLFRRSSALESLARPGEIWLDKTGTLTEGTLRVVDWTGSEEVAEYVRALEKHSRHPVATALLKDLPGDGELEAHDVEQTLGGGISGTVDGHHVAVGSAHYIASTCGQEVENESGDHSVVHVAVDGQRVARISLRDRLRPRSADAVRELSELGWSVGILSGDSQSVVDRVATDVGVRPESAYGGQSPEMKLASIERAARNPVVMVGDGVNDAAALAAADVGIAVHGGVDVASTAASVVITRPGLESLTLLADGCRRTLGVIHRNLWIALIYNVVGVTLAMTGNMNPLVAAVLMPLSSVTVVLSSFRSRMFTEPASKEPAPEAEPMGRPA